MFVVEETREDASEEIVLNTLDPISTASTSQPELASLTSFIRKVAED